MVYSLDFNSTLIQESSKLFNDDFELSAQQINEICESFAFSLREQDECIHEATVLLEAQAKLARSIGANNFESECKSTASKVVKVLKTEGINAESKKKIHNIVSDMFEEMAHSLSFKEIVENDKLKECERPKIVRGCLLVLWVLLINTLCHMILSLLVGPLGGAITTIVVAPLVEEVAKSISIKGKFDKEFFLVFNIYEAGSYISQMVAGGVPAGLAVKIRAICVGMHATTTVIHKIFSLDEIKKKFNLGNEKEANDKATFASYIIGILIHGTWNTLATFSGTFTRIVTGGAV